MKGIDGLSGRRWTVASQGVRTGRRRGAALIVLALGLLLATSTGGNRAEAAPFRRGDVNQDGSLDISDAVNLLGYLFLGERSKVTECRDSGDVDDRGDVDISDAVAILNFLFQGAREPAPPFRECGEDPTPGDPLDCVAFAPCGGASVKQNVRLITADPQDRRDPQLIAIDVEAGAGQVVVRDARGGADVRSGDVIVGELPPDSPLRSQALAYMFKVGAAVSQDGDIKVFNVTPALLTDVFNEVSFTQTFDLEGATVMLLDEDGGAGAQVVADGRGAARIISINRDGAVLHDGPIPGGGHLRLALQQARLNLDADVTLIYEAAFGIPTRVELSYDSALAGVLELVADATARVPLSIYEKRIVEVRKSLPIFYIGTIPVNLNVHFFLIAGARADISARISANIGAAVDLSGRVGLRFTPAGVTNLTAFAPPSLRLVPDPPRLSVNESIDASLRIYVHPEAHVTVGLAGVPVEPGAGLKLDAHVLARLTGRVLPPPPCFDWSVGAGIDATVSPMLTVLGHKVLNRTIPLYNQSWTLLQGRLCEPSDSGLPLHLSGVALGGGIWHTMLTPVLGGGRTWTPFQNISRFTGVEGMPGFVGFPAPFSNVDTAQSGGILHMIAVNTAEPSRASLWYVTRDLAGNWGSWSERVGAFTCSIAPLPGMECPGPFISPRVPRLVDVGCAMIDGRLHVCAVGDDGSLWYTMRDASGMWTVWSDVRGVASNPGAFSNVDCAAVGRDLHVVGVTGTGSATMLWHGVRSPSGAWTPFGNAGAAAGMGAPGSFRQVGAAGVRGELHLSGVASNGGLWHTIRFVSGSWQPFGNVIAAAGQVGSFTFIDAAGAGSDLHLAGPSMDGEFGFLWHTVRHPTFWEPFDDVERPISAGGAGHAGTVFLASSLAASQ